MSTPTIIKLRAVLQHAEVISNFSRLLDRVADLLIKGQVSNRPDVPTISAAELVEIVGEEQVRKIVAARAAFYAPELLDPKPEPEPKIIYITEVADPVAVPDNFLADPVTEPVAEPAFMVEPPAEPVAEPVAESVVEPVTE